eukprot:Amastigsp_a5714_17.p5 type:complete len:118 gc:universal Amastigsp_a5714_17:291-644(+)
MPARPRCSRTRSSRRRRSGRTFVRCACSSRLARKCVPLRTARASRTLRMCSRPTRARSCSFLRTAFVRRVSRSTTSGLRSRRCLLRPRALASRTLRMASRSGSPGSAPRAGSLQART